jgi:hypothetical protein
MLWLIYPLTETPIIHFYEAFVPTAGKDVVVTMQSLFISALFIWLVYD